MYQTYNLIHGSFKMLAINHLLPIQSRLEEMLIDYIANMFTNGVFSYLL